MAKNKIEVSVILSMEETYNGNMFTPIGVVYCASKDNIYDVIKEYFKKKDIEVSEDVLDEIADYLYNDNVYDCWNNSDIYFKIESTFIFE